MANNRAKITTQKWRAATKTMKYLPVVIHNSSKFYKELKPYLNVVGRGTYSATYQKDVFTIDFLPNKRAMTFSERTSGSSSYFQFYASLKSGLTIPTQFKKATPISEKQVSLNNNKLVIDLRTQKKSASKRAASTTLPALSGLTKKDIQQVIANSLKRIPQTTGPAMDMDELSQTLADKMGGQFNDQVSQHLADEIMDRLTRSDDFMNRLADTVGFKLATTMSTRFNRQDEALKAEFKELFSKMEKQLTRNTFNMFQEAGWLK